MSGRIDLAALRRHGVKADEARQFVKLTPSELAALVRAVRAAHDLVVLATYDQDPRTWNAQWLAAINDLGEALAPFEKGEH